MAVTIKKLGGDVQINVDTTLFYVESPTARRRVVFDNRVSPPKLEIIIGTFDSGPILLSTLKLGDAEATPADLADFQTKWGAVFPNASGGSGSSTVTTDTTISGDGSPGSPLSVVSTLEATRIHAATSKATPVDADEIALIDSAASNVLKKTLWSAVKATLKAYFDTLYPSGSGTSSGTNTGDQTTVSGNAGTATILANTRTIDGQNFNGSANITVIAPGTHAATSKGTPVDADELSLVDSEASNVLKKLTWTNLKATVKAYFDTLYNPLNTNLVDKTVTNTYTAGAKQVFGANATNAGVGFGGVTADPSTPVSGDLWFRSDLSKWRYYDGSTTRSIVTEALTQTLTNKTATNLILSAGISTTSTGTPTIAGGTAAGTSPTITVTGTDVAGSLNITTGSSPSTTSNDIIATITFSATLAAVPKAILLSPGNNLSSQHFSRIFCRSADFTTGQFVVKITATGGGLSASQPYIWFYWVIQ